MRRLFLIALFSVVAVSAHAGGDALPSGYLSVSGNQINDASGNHVRLACVGYPEPTGNYSSDIASMRSEGFNCLRFDWYDATLNLVAMDVIVAAAAANNMKMIFDHHGNEATLSCLGQQSNGLWYDKNDNSTIYTSSNNTDGCGANGNFTYAAFKANWILIAQHFANNPTVIGFDLHNEPLTYGGVGLNWGGGGGADLRAMCQDVGTAINAVNSGALIICEGPISNNSNLFSGTSQVVSLSTDLSTAGTKPVSVSNKVVYSIHTYPTHISGSSPDSGDTMIQGMNDSWGYLVKNGTAPVWIGEMGAYLDGTNNFLPDEQAWASTVVNYVNGLSGGKGGPTFTGTQQGIGTDWFAWGYLPGQDVDGTLNADGTSRTGQMAYWSQLLYHSSSTAATTTWNPGDISAGMTLSGNNLVATSATPVPAGVRSTTSKSSGKACIVVTETVATNHGAVGISTSAENLASYLGDYGGSTGVGLYTDYSGQPIIVQHATVASGGTAGSVSGDRVMIALDATAQKAWFSDNAMVAAGLPWDNSATDNPATGMGGVSLSFIQPPYFIEANTSDSGSVYTINPTPTGCPAGFPTWDTVVANNGRPISVILGLNAGLLRLPVSFYPR